MRLQWPMFTYIWTISLRWVTRDWANWVLLRISTRILQFTHWCILLLCEAGGCWVSLLRNSSLPSQHILSSHFATWEFAIEIFHLLHYKKLMGTSFVQHDGTCKMKITCHVMLSSLCQLPCVMHSLMSCTFWTYCSRRASNRRPLWSSWAMFHFQLKPPMQLSQLLREVAHSAFS